MHGDDTRHDGHDHSFGQDAVRPGERRTAVVIAVTTVTMVVEIVAGLAFGSMALLADGLHMASHAGALAIALFAYVYARRRAHDRRFSFGTGKVNALAAFSSALLLVLFAGLMAVESMERLVFPTPIAFGPAVAVAVVGLVVNVVSAFILVGGGHGHGHGHGHHDHDHDHDHDHHHHHDHDDANLRAAYLHVLADALTSALAIVALLGGWLMGWTWLDPAMGIVGAVLVARWAYGLIRQSAEVLLDFQGPRDLREAVAAAVESDGDSRIADLHLWSLGPGLFTVVLSVISGSPRQPDEYKARLPAGLVHPIVEVLHRPPQ